MNKLIGFAVLACVLNFGCASVGSADPYPYVKATVYYFQWFYVTEKMPKPQFIRDQASIVTSIHDDTETAFLTKLLHLDKMEAWNGKEAYYPLALVIDFIDRDGKVETYYSDGCYLYSADWSRRGKIDPALRDRFGFSELDDEVQQVFHKRISEMCTQG